MVVRRSRSLLLPIAGFVVSCQQSTDDLKMPPEVVEPPRSHAFVTVDTVDGRTCAVEAAGEVYCWGFVPGPDGEPTDVVVPTRISGVSGAIGVAIGVVDGGTYACAVVADLGVYCWGHMSSPRGESPTFFESPTLLAGSEGALAVDAEGDRVCIITAERKVRCWGRLTDTSGCFPMTDGVRSIDDPPVELASLDGAVSLRMSGGATCAVRTGNNLTCVVYSVTTAQPQTIDVQTGDIRDVNLFHSEGCFVGPGALCVARGSRVECLGDVGEAAGFVPDGPTIELPPVAAPIRRIVMSLGPDTLCVETEGDELWCSSEPDAPVLERVRHTSGTIRHFCAIVQDDLRCWGSNEFGELGNGVPSHYAEPRTVVGVEGATSLAAGTHHTCAANAEGTVHCWGVNSTNQRGWSAELSKYPPFFPFVDRTVESHLPQAVAGVAPSTGVFAAGYRTCSGHRDGITCWGQDFTHRLSLEAPTVIPEVGAAVSIASGDDSESCAVALDGSVRCWGRGYYGTRGGVELLALPGPADQVDGDTYLGCARLRSGEVYCWGGRVEGSIADGRAMRPMRRPDIDDAIDLSGACVVTSDHRLLCWDHPLSEEPGRATELARGVMEVDGPCVIRDDRTVACFLDYGARWSTIGTTLQAVPGARDAVAIAAGERHACLLRADGRVACWGWAAGGRLGDGSQTVFIEAQVAR